VREHVIPLLIAINIPFELHETESVRDAGRIGKHILSGTKSGDSGTTITVVIAGGDGTAHEMIEGILEDVQESKRDLSRWELVILPLGTVSTHASPSHMGRRLTLSCLDYRPTLCFIRSSLLNSENL
jgi:diacylglycerol kinase family enzyme